MGLRGGLRWELGDGGRGSRFAISLKSGEMFPIGPRFPRAAGWVWGALGVSKEGIKRAWGRPLPQDGPLGPKRREAPSPILRLRRRCHSGAGHASTAAGEAPSPQRA